jgi:demethylmenaquinone methyltransferase/2-methoxy-6-polyprenyl-1,4-benzoquinol methylase
MDRAFRMLARASGELDRARRVARLYQADARHLPFSDGVFDVVMSAHMLEHLPEPWVGLGEMVRVLRPQGLILLVTTSANALEAALRLAWRYRTLEPNWMHNCLRRMGIIRLHTYRIGQTHHLARCLSRAHVGIKE